MTRKTLSNQMSGSRTLINSMLNKPQAPALCMVIMMILDRNGANGK